MAGGTVAKYIESGDDDGWETADGLTTFSASSITWEMQNHISNDAIRNSAFFRFTNLDIPATGTVVQALLYLFVADKNIQDIPTTTGTVHVEDSDSVVDLAANADIVNRTVLSGSDSFSFTYTLTGYQGIEFITPLQQLVNDYGGLSSADIGIIVEMDNSQTKVSDILAMYEYATINTEPYIQITWYDNTYGWNGPQVILAS